MGVRSSVNATNHAMHAGNGPQVSMPKKLSKYWDVFALHQKPQGKRVA